MSNNIPAKLPPTPPIVDADNTEESDAGGIRKARDFAFASVGVLDALPAMANGLANIVAVPLAEAVGSDFRFETDNVVSGLMTGNPRDLRAAQMSQNATELAALAVPVGSGVVTAASRLASSARASRAVARSTPRLNFFGHTNPGATGVSEAFTVGRTGSSVRLEGTVGNGYNVGVFNASTGEQLALQVGRGEATTQGVLGAGGHGVSKPVPFALEFQAAPGTAVEIRVSAHAESIARTSPFKL